MADREFFWGVLWVFCFLLVDRVFVRKSRPLMHPCICTIWFSCDLFMKWAVVAVGQCDLQRRSRGFLRLKLDWTMLMLW